MGIDSGYVAGLKFLVHDGAHIRYVVYEFASRRCELSACLSGSAAGFLGRDPPQIAFLPSPEVGAYCSYMYCVLQP